MYLWIVHLSQYIENTPINPNSSFLCKFYIMSLYINVSWNETIAINGDALSEFCIDNPSFSEMVFLKLIHIASKWIQFNFNDTMYQQINGVAMGSPLGAVTAYIFVGFQAEKLFRVTNKPLYVRYILTAHVLCSPADQRTDDFLFN